MISLTAFKKPAVSPRLVAKIGDKFTRSELAVIERFGTGTTIDAGDVFVAQGTVGREVILIVSGSAVVSRDGDEIAVVGPGDFVGERALLLGATRNASLIATTDLEVEVYNVREFRSLLAASATLAIKLRALADLRS